eukprot:CCRYP_017374-RA/>CCRYP_017374-RA protein AED:0.12 eAED:0.12 QI:154/1/1/1/1/1/2/166/180
MGGCIPSSAAAYPGDKRPQKPAYQPAANEFQQVDSNTAVCTTHFVTCPGGNALKLVGKPNRAENQGGVAEGGLAKYVQVTLPPGVQPGDVIHVRAPDGRLNAITVPEGMGPGSTFTVEFADDLPPPPAEEDLTPGVYVPTVIAEPEVQNGGSGAVISGGDGGVVASATTGPYVPASYATK